MKDMEIKIEIVFAMYHKAEYRSFWENFVCQ